MHSFQMLHSKKYVPYNMKPPKKVSHLIHSGSQSSSRHKEDIKAAKADYESRIQGTIWVEIADAAGSVSMHHLTSAIPSTSTPIALKEDEEPPEDVSSQQWLESMEDIVAPSDDSSMAPLLSEAPGSKSRIRTTVNWEKKSAWWHWHQNIIYTKWWGFISKWKEREQIMCLFPSLPKLYSLKTIDSRPSMESAVTVVSHPMNSIPLKQSTFLISHNFLFTPCYHTQFIFVGIT